MYTYSYLKARQLYGCFYFLLFFIMAQQTSAQLSDLHYLPPLRQGENNQAIREQAVYLSTPASTAFNVTIYRGTSTVPMATLAISNSSPVTYELSDGDNNITLVDEDHTGVVLNDSGLRFVGEDGKKFYVNYRGNSDSQGTSLTAKGRVAMGTSFKWGGVPNLGQHSSKSNTLGIMATEDNTTITLSGYDPDCEFRVRENRAGITADAHTIILNANESFVYETYIGTTPTLAHERGWIGASIEADKDIVISNGSLNYGRQVGSGNRDAGIDQPVPENRLGRDYVFVRGNGNSNGWTEFPLLIATQDETEIYINGSNTAITVLDEGEFFEVPSSYYSSNDAGANMYIHTSKNVYAYQCVGGDEKAFTQGLNFVAPVNCLLPNSLDNIPDITDAAGVTIVGGVIITASSNTPNSNITVTDGNGPVTLPAPNTVAGTNDWKTFYLPNLTGNVSVTSSGPIVVSSFGFNGNRGVAVYYTGFDTIPIIQLQATGENCYPGAVLEIASSETFDSYQWYYNGAEIPGANSPTYTASERGEYYLEVERGSCTYASNIIPVYNCDPDVALSKTSDKTMVTEGETMEFTITAQNFSVDAITGLVVTDMLPDGLELVSASTGRGTFTYPDWTIGTLEAGKKAELTLIARAGLSDIYVNSENRINLVTNSQDQTDNNLSPDSPQVMITINRTVPTGVITNRRITYRVDRN